MPLSLMLHVSSVQAKAQSLTAEEWVLLRVTEYKRRLRTRIGSDYIVSIKSLRNRFIETFEQADFGSDGITAEDFEILDRKKIQRKFAYNIQSWLMKDINRDFVVTKRELKIFYHKRASKSIRSGRTYIRKTREQIDQALEDMILRDLVMDINGDNEITFEETKNYFEKKSKIPKYPNRSGRFSRFNILYNKKIPFSFDLNENQKIEQQEYLQIIDRVISRYNKDNNNVLSSNEMAEVDSMKRTIRQKFRTKKFWRSPQRKKLNDDKFTKEI